MARHCLLMLITAWAGVLLATSIAVGQATADVTFSAKYQDNPTAPLNFYYNERAVGSDREGFKIIVDRIRKLPAGTSIVWGPNFDRCGACGGGEPMAENRFPDLWKELEAIVKERGLALSSDYPGPSPWPVPPEQTEWPIRPAETRLPAALFAENPPSSERFDAVLDWKVGGKSPDDFGERHLGYWLGFSSGGKPLGLYDVDLLFGRLPENARVLIRISLPKDAEATNFTALAEDIRHTWEHVLSDQVRLGRLNVTMTAPVLLVETLRARAKSNGQPTSIGWSNFRGPSTPHNEVLYELNGEFIGRGDEGLDRVIARIDQLPVGSHIVFPRYVIGGRWAHDLYTEEEVESINKKLQATIPFAARKRELAAKIRERNLKVTFSPWQLSASDKSRNTVMDWGATNRYAQAFVEFGRIVRYDERPRPAAARLSWARYNASQLHHERQAEDQAFYTLDDAEIGQGVPAFAKIMDRLAALPPGSVVQVRVCLRTKAPFICPLIYEGQRHFERTGWEPYSEMLPWLVDVARKRQLKVEWVPDEQQSCEDCELNK